MIDVEGTIASQYATSPVLVQLVENMNQYFDPRSDFDAFYNFVWNVDTAVGFGLDVWGRIVDVSRLLTIPSSETNFGFFDGVGDYAPFGQAPFFNGSSSSQTFVLADDAYRTLILVKALANISATTPSALNQLIQNLFAGRGRCYTNDMGSMGMRYTFEFYLTPYELAVLNQSGVLSHPAGVSVSILQEDPTAVFGFDGSGLEPFNQGTFG
jgi:hypothetical protein